MLRLVLLIAVILVLSYWLERQWLRLTGRNRGRSGPARSVRRAPSERPRQRTELVQCSRCGVRIAKDRAIAGERPGELFCSDTCRSAQRIP